MALNIKNKEVEELTRELAEATDRSQVEVMLVALRKLRAEIHSEQSKHIERKRRALFGWIAELRRSPIVPVVSREDAEAELYDDSGLPK
ncbi:MAG: type II toxin-antitoxin system VapB family antitoxin [Myxococcaceae bacterium]